MKGLFSCWLITLLSVVFGLATHDLEWALPALMAIATMLYIIGEGK